MNRENSAAHVLPDLDVDDVGILLERLEGKGKEREQPSTKEAGGGTSKTDLPGALVDAALESAAKLASLRAKMERYAHKESVSGKSAKQVEMREVLPRDVAIDFVRINGRVQNFSRALEEGAERFAATMGEAAAAEFRRDVEILKARQSERMYAMLDAEKVGKRSSDFSFKRAVEVLTRALQNANTEHSFESVDETIASLIKSHPEAESYYLLLQNGVRESEQERNAPRSGKRSKTAAPLESDAA